MVSLTIARDTDFGGVVAGGLLGAARCGALVVCVEVFASAVPAEGGTDVGHADGRRVAVLEAVTAEHLFVVRVHAEDASPLVVHDPHEFLRWIHAGEHDGWFGGEGDEDGGPGLVLL